MHPSALHHVLDLLAAWIWRNSWQAAILFAVVGAVQFLLRRRLAPQWRYALGLLVVIRLALPMVPASPLSIFNLGAWLADLSTPRHLAATGSDHPADLANPAFPPEPLFHGGAEATLATLELSPTPGPAAAPSNTASTFRFSLELIWLAGALTMLTVVARQHHRLQRAIRRQPAGSDPHLAALLADCQAAMGMKRALPLTTLPGLSTPALFGLWRPRLLVPVGLWESLDPAEVRLIFQHELTHLRRGDLVLNWVLILLRAAHWFNPVVWLAFRRLRADQELACDAVVITRLAPGESRRYGNTLLKLLELFPPAGLGPVLVPFLTNKNILKRRIAMIASIKPTSRFSLIASLALLSTLGCLTLTRADDKRAKGTADQKDPAALLAVTKAEPAAPEPESNRRRMITDQVMTEKLAETENRIAATKDGIQRLCSELGVAYEPGAGVIVPGADAESLRHFHAIKADSEFTLVRQSKLLEELRKLSSKQLRQAIPTAMPDPLLNQLLQDQLIAENKLADLRTDFGDAHPQVVRQVRLLKDLETRIDARVEGIMLGAAVTADAMRAQIDSTGDKIKTARDAYIKASSAAQTFGELQHEIEFQLKLKDSLKLRLQDLRIEMEIENRTGEK